MSTAPTEEILRFLSLYSERSINDPENIYTLISTRDGEEIEASLTVSDLQKVLAERREAIELLAATHRGDYVYTATRDFLANIESEA